MSRFKIERLHFLRIAIILHVSTQNYICRYSVKKKKKRHARIFARGFFSRSRVTFERELCIREKREEKGLAVAQKGTNHRRCVEDQKDTLRIFSRHSAATWEVARAVNPFLSATPVISPLSRTPPGRSSFRRGENDMARAMNSARPCNSARSLEMDRYFVPVSLESYTKAAGKRRERDERKRVHKLSGKTGESRLRKRNADVICLKFSTYQ